MPVVWTQQRDGSLSTTAHLTAERNAHGLTIQQVAQGGNPAITVNKHMECGWTVGGVRARYLCYGSTLILT